MNICDESSSSWQQTMAAAYTHRCSGPAGPRGKDVPLHERELSSLSCHQNITRLPRKLLAADTWTPPRMQDGGKKHRWWQAMDLIGRAVSRKVLPVLLRSTLRE